MLFLFRTSGLALRHAEDSFAVHSSLTRLSTEPGELIVHLSGFSCRSHAYTLRIGPDPQSYFSGEHHSVQFTVILLQPTRFWTRYLRRKVSELASLVPSTTQG